MRTMMTTSLLALLVAAPMVAAPLVAEAETVCTAVQDAADGTMLIAEGDCERAVTPASTFKVAISLMGYDAGILKDLHDPALPFREGYPDWREAWKQTTDPTHWMKESVVWYSQVITRDLGPERFRGYVEAFGYGNEDVSGDPGADNGLTNSWLSSSLRISPMGELAFLGKVVRHELPVSDRAYEMTAALMDYGVSPGGWRIHGKTGAGLPVAADGAKVRGKPYGWFVGWATKGERTVTFAHLIQDPAPQDTPPSFRARDRVIGELFGAPGAIP